MESPAAPDRTATSWRSWALWELPPATTCLILAVTALAATLAVVAGASLPGQPRDLVVFATLVGAAAVSVEATRRVPEPAGMNANDMLGAWLVPIAVLLPPGYSMLAPMPLMALTQWRVRRIAVHKRVYSASAIGVAHAAASALYHALPARLTDPAILTTAPGALVLAVAVAAVAAKVINAVLIGLAVKTSDPQTSWAEALVVDRACLEAAEVCTGVLIALLAGSAPWLVAVALPPVLVLQRGMLYAQLHAAARVDAKTGLLNASSWEREVAAELARLRRLALPASVLLVDIDHFKRVNDTYGHLAGDDVLRATAAALRGQLRTGTDLIGRFGGEEFAVLLAGIGSAQAQRTAERLRRSVAALAVAIPGGEVVRVTVSVGVGALNTPEPSVSELLAAADLGLYRAKADGRDLVRLLAEPDRRAGMPAEADGRPSVDPPFSPPTRSGQPGESVGDAGPAYWGVPQADGDQLADRDDRRG